MMKNTLTLFVVLFIVLQSKAQPIGGFEYLFNNINLKEELGNKVMRSLTLKYIIVKIRFVVEKDGLLTNMTVLEDDFNLANDIFKIIKDRSKWQPAEFEGKIVPMNFTLPLKIALN